MAMSSKLVAVFLVCTVLIAAMHIHRAEAHLGEVADDVKARFKECFNSCLGECSNKGHGYMFCEMKCDSRCGAKEAATKLGINVNKDD